MRVERTTGIVIGVVAGIAVVAAFVFLSSNNTVDSASLSGGKTQTIEIAKDRTPIGGVAKFVYKRGDQIRIDVHSAVAGQVHFHGYNIEKEVRAGATASFDFPANLEGDFEIELHGNPDRQIADVKVEPR